MHAKSDRPALASKGKRIHSAWSDMCQIGHTVQWLDALPPEVLLPSIGARDIIATGLVVTYARPFTKDKKKRRLERDEWIDEPYREAHDRFVALRDGLYAHTDRGIPWRTITMGPEEATNAGLGAILHNLSESRFLEVTTEPDIGLAELGELATHVSAKLYTRLDEIETLLGATPLPPGNQGTRRMHVLPEGGYRATEVDYHALLNPPTS